MTHDLAALQRRWDADHDRARFAALRAVARSMPRSEIIGGAMVVPLFIAFFAALWVMLP